MANLWNLKLKSSDTSALPILYPGSSGNPGTISTDGLGISTAYPNKMHDAINVVESFPWTVSPQSSRADVPVIRMIESRVKLNSTVTNLNYSIQASTESIKRAANGLASLTGQKDKLNNIFNADDPDKGADKADDGGLLQQFNNIKNDLRDAVKSVGFSELSNEALKPYEGLYALERTGFVYHFPYLTEEYNELSNSFGLKEEGIIAPIANQLAGVAEGIAGLVNIVKPGTYIEKAQQYTMGEEGRILNFSIPLLNTLNSADITRNWQLIYGLLYQNRPGRVSKSIIDQPVLYEVEVPGVAYMPYAYISGLNVKFLGASRKMKITVPVYPADGADMTEIETIIPDAFQIDISVTGLNEETRNFMYASVTQNKISTGEPVDYSDFDKKPEPEKTPLQIAAEALEKEGAEYYRAVEEYKKKAAQSIR